MKRILSILVVTALVLGMASTCVVSAQEESFTVTMQIGNPIMVVNGSEMEIDPGRGTAPVAENGRTLIPIRALVEAMGGKVDWSQSSQSVTHSQTIPI